MRSHLTRIVVPAVGLLAVTTALALIGTAPLVLFPASKEAGPRPPAPAASTQVASVAARALTPRGGAEAPSTTESPGSPANVTPTTGAPVAPRLGNGSGTIERPQGPRADEPDVTARPESEPAREKKGKAKGHAKDKAQGKAKGHTKWQGRTP